MSKDWRLYYRSNGRIHALAPCDMHEYAEYSYITISEQLAARLNDDLRISQFRVHQSDGVPQLFQIRTNELAVTEVTDTQVVDTEASDTEASDTEVNDTEVDDTEAADTQIGDTQIDVIEVGIEQLEQEITHQQSFALWNEWSIGSRNAPIQIIQRGNIVKIQNHNYPTGKHIFYIMRKGYWEWPITSILLPSKCAEITIRLNYLQLEFMCHTLNYESVEIKKTNADI